MYVWESAYHNDVIFLLIYFTLFCFIHICNSSIKVKLKLTLTPLFAAIIIAVVYYYIHYGSCHFFVLGNSGLKVLTTIGISFVTGAIVNQFSTSYSPKKQGIFIGIVSGFILFINLRKVWMFINSMFIVCCRFVCDFFNRCYNCLFNSLQNKRATSSNISSPAQTDRF